MKRNIFIIGISIVFLIFISSCGNNSDEHLPTDIIYNPNTASGKADMENLPKIEFEEEVHDFGKVIQGEKVTYGFKFKNTGKTDMLISNVSTSCGCAVTKYPKIPIQPGEEKILYVSFDSEGRKGFQNKSITVISNTQPNTKVLRIKARVVVP